MIGGDRNDIRHLLRGDCGLPWWLRAGEVSGTRTLGMAGDKNVKMCRSVPSDWTVEFRQRFSQSLLVSEKPGLTSLVKPVDLGYGECSSCSAASGLPRNLCPPCHLPHSQPPKGTLGDREANGVRRQFIISPHGVRR